MGTVDVDNRKRELRRRFRAIRKAIPREEREAIDAAICERVCSLQQYAEACLVLPYLSFGAEVDTHPLIERAWADGKTVAIPWCVPGTREMRWFRIDGYEGLVRSPIGVDEPNPETAEEVDITGDTAALTLVPGLTFDPYGYRLGYGGGFYDTFLSSFEGVSVGLCRECQMSPDLLAEGIIDAHDLPVRLVVTEERVVRGQL